MSRPPRREAESGIHHVMNRGVDRQPVFLSDDDRLDFGHQLIWVHEHLGVKLFAYCLMGNHYHLLLRVPEGVLSDAMQHVGSVFTRHFNDRHGRDGPVFRGRFTSIPVEDDAYLLTVVRYIHRNPVGLPGVVRPVDYRWSSYRAYLGLRPTPAFLDTSFVMSMLGGRDRLVAVTEAPSTPSIDGLGPRLLPGRPVTMTEVRSVVRSAIAMADIDQELSREASWRALGATVELLLVDRLDVELGRLVAANQPRRSLDAARMARLRAEKRLEADPIVGRTLVAVLAYFARTSGVRHQPFAGTFGA